MKTEELYDSLEEDFSSASSTSMVIKESDYPDELRLDLSANENEDSTDRYEDDNNFAAVMDCSFTPLSQRKINSDRSETTPNSKRLLKTRIPCYKLLKSLKTCKNIGDISSIIPLYDGDVKKSEIQMSQNQVLRGKASRAKFKLKSKFTNPNTGSCVSIEALPKTDPIKSYLNIFHDRIGYPNPEKKELNDTMRSIFGDSERSALSETSIEQEDFQDAQGYESDTASYYFKQIEESQKSMTSPNSLVSSVPPSNYESMSEIFDNNCNNNRAHIKKLRERKYTLLQMPTLGSLGPDNTLSKQEKLERRKKQLSYGQKASNRNRMKMVEINVLKNLKKEIQESNSLDQKTDCQICE